MKLTFERNSLGMLETPIPRVILPDFQRAVWVFDDPHLRENPEVGKVFPLFLEVVVGLNLEPTQSQMQCIEWILANAEKINARAESFLRRLAKEEMGSIVEDEVNDRLCEKYTLRSPDGYKRMYGLISVTVTEVHHNGLVPYILSISSAYDDEHGLSLLFLEDRLIASSGSTDFLGRGQQLIPHARCCRGYSSGYDQIDIG